MRECQICGLLFLGTDCPGCGSRTTIVLDAMGEGSQTLAQRGGLPGLDRLGESLGEIIKDSDMVSLDEEKPSSSLPFDVGGNTSNQMTSLPFGIGSNPAVEHDATGTQTHPEVDDESADRVAETAPPVKITAIPVEVEKTVDSTLPVRVEAIPTNESSPTKYSAANMDEIYAEDADVVHHDFSGETITTEVMVNLDDIAEPISASMVFTPEVERDISDPELFPSKALDLNIPNGTQESELSAQGFNAMANSQWENAAITFQQLAKMHPTNARIMNNYGLALLERAIAMQADDHFSLIDGADTQFEAAIMALRQAAQNDPQETAILYNLGNALASSGRYDKALRIFNAFLERSPATNGVLNGRAASLIGLGRFDEASKDLREAVSQFGEHPVISSNLRRLTPV